MRVARHGAFPGIALGMPGTIASSLGGRGTLPAVSPMRIRNYPILSVSGSRLIHPARTVANAGRIFCAQAIGGGSASGNVGDAQSPTIPPSVFGGPPGGGNVEERLLAMTSTPEGEIRLFKKAQSALRGTDEDADGLGAEWLCIISEGVRKPGSEITSLIERPLVKELTGMLDRPLFPAVNNFTPDTRTPWGGTDIPKMKKLTNVPEGLVVGESWEISGHPSFPNSFSLNYAGQDIAVDIGVLEKIFPERLFGGQVSAAFNGKMPFLTKLLNSGSWSELKGQLGRMLSYLETTCSVSVKWKEELGVSALANVLKGSNHEILMAVESILKDKPATAADKTYGAFEALENFWRHPKTGMVRKNLSVQIHPPKGYRDDAPSKTEAWYILAAEEGAGIYLGLKEGVSEEMMRARLESGEDVTDLMNFIEVKSGETYFIPAGTPHAIGAGLLLVEPQETSETTFRYYDYNIIGEDGKPRQLHVEDALAVTKWDGPRGKALVDSLRRVPSKKDAVVGEGSAVVESLVSEGEFDFDRITFAGKGQTFEGVSFERISALTVVSGELELTGPDGNLLNNIDVGRSVIIPAGVIHYKLKSKGDEAVILQTSTSMK